jgi:hypothetical protein
MMNVPNPKPNPEPDTTVLNLGKVVAEPAATDPAPGESVTTYISKAAAEAARESSKPVIVPEGAGPLPPQTLLGAVSYCYAKGVCGSSDIERKMRQDTQFRASCGQEIPRAEDIRRFRRLNRETIQATLEKAFRFTRKKVAETWKPSNPFRSDSGVALTGGASGQGNPGETQAFVRREASERLDKAGFIDGMSM